jgi:AcrR family transcriptional regulator
VNQGVNVTVGSSPSTSPTAATRDRIKSVARELYVRRGHEGFSFGDVAQLIGTTRPNIHYHFGNKRQLMAELIDDFVADALIRIARHWTTPGESFDTRLTRQCDDLRAFYHRFNPAVGERTVWSPIARLRLDLPVLGELAITALERVNSAYSDCLGQALREAVASGEFRPDVPVEEAARLLRAVIMSCEPITQDKGSFAEVDRLFAALRVTLYAAWGTHPAA